jgi:hypothetical protein
MELTLLAESMVPSREAISINNPPKVSFLDYTPIFFLPSTKSAR